MIAGWGNWQVHTEAEDFNATVALWIYRIVDNNHGVELLRFDSLGELIVTRRESNAGPMGDPTMRLPRTVAAELGAALIGLLPPDQSQAAHLRDAIAVRDRMLVLVEKLSAT